MVSREQKRASALHEKFQILRSITQSHAIDKTSIIADASKYIGELKEKVNTLNQDIANAEAWISSDHPSLPAQVTVETVEKGFLINVFSQRSCPGLLVSILEAFEELGLNVHEARVSCADSFRLQAVGENEGQDEIIGAQVVEQAVVQAIQKWSEASNNEDAA